MERAVVITGASSGIGRVTARRLASRGFSLVLAARSLNELETIAEECRKFDVDVLVQQTDVTNTEDMYLLADIAQAAFGSIEVWINNAGVTEVGKFIDIDRDEFRRVVETNFFGVVNGSRAALDVFLKQGRGVLINMSSVLGMVTDPYESPYVASKFAVRGFSASLRQELYLDGYDGIHVCTVMPATMNTPIYRNAANKSGRVPLSIPPVYPAEMVAETIEKLIDNPKSEVVVGGAGRLMIVINKLVPGLFEKMFAHYIKAFHFKRQKAANTKGSLVEPSPYTQEYGGQVTVPKYIDKLLMGGLLISAAVLLYKVKKARSRHE